MNNGIPKKRINKIVTYQMTCVWKVPANLSNRSLPRQTQFSSLHMLQTLYCISIYSYGHVFGTHHRDNRHDFQLNNLVLGEETRNCV